MFVFTIAFVCSGSSEENLKSICCDLGVEDCTLLSGEELNLPTSFLVFLNGLIVGVVANPAILADKVLR